MAQPKKPLCANDRARLLEVVRALGEREAVKSSGLSLDVLTKVLSGLPVMRAHAARAVLFLQAHKKVPSVPEEAWSEDDYAGLYG